MMSSFHEIYLIANRYLILKNRNHWIVNIRLKYYIPFLVILPLFLLAPIFPAISVKESKENTQLFYWAWTIYAQNAYFKFYLGFLAFAETILPLITLIIMNILCNIQYKKRIKFKLKVKSQTIKDLKKLENAYTRITIILTTLFIVTRTLDFFSSLLTRGMLIFDIRFASFIISTIILIRRFSFVLFYGLNSLDVILYIKNDRNIKILIKRKFEKIKVSFKWFYFSIEFINLKNYFK